MDKINHEIPIASFMSLNSVWKTLENSSTAKWELGEAETTSATLTVATDTPLSGGTLQVGDDTVSLLALEKKGEGDLPLDTYVRGSDLVARFNSQGHPFDREVYWRVIDCDAAQGSVQQEESVDDDLMGVELIYSLQTDSLNSSPAPKVTSLVPMKSFKVFSVVGASTDANRSWKASDDLACSQLLVATLAGGAKLALGAFPSDLASLEIENPKSPCPVVFHLNSDFLEKGVIRRTRMFVCCGGPSVDEARLIQQATAFLNSEIPLTT